MDWKYKNKPESVLIEREREKKKKENIIGKYIVDIQWFDVEYGIYFTSETEYFIFIAKEIF